MFNGWCMTFARSFYTVESKCGLLLLQHRFVCHCIHTVLYSTNLSRGKRKKIAFIWDGIYKTFLLSLFAQHLGIKAGFTPETFFWHKYQNIGTFQV